MFSNKKKTYKALSCTALSSLVLALATALALASLALHEAAAAAIALVVLDCALVACSPSSFFSF